MDWESDWGLRLRMGISLVVLSALPFGFIYAMQWGFNEFVFPTVDALTETPFRFRLAISPGTAAAIVLLGFVGQYLLGDWIALQAVNARRVSDEDAPDLLSRVRRLANTAAAPTPRVAISDSTVPNAFTVGRRPGTPTVVVTVGLLEALDGDELDAVLAHELAHVKNRDVTLMSVAYFLPALTYKVALLAYLILYLLSHSVRGLGAVDGDDARGIFVAFAVLFVSAILTLTISVLFWTGSFLLFLILSRYRECAADRGAAAITSDVFPETHPPTKARIEQLRSLAGEVES